MLKLIGNFIRLSTIEVLCEASVLSEKAGLSQETLQKFTEALIPGPATAQLKMLQSGDYYKLSKVKKTGVQACPLLIEKNGKL